MGGFYKRHRAILDSDIIHLRRADGRDLDYILHVNPALEEKGFLMVYNPLPQRLSEDADDPALLHRTHRYAGVREQDGERRELQLGSSVSSELPVSVPANGFTWFVIESRRSRSEHASSCWESWFSRRPHRAEDTELYNGIRVPTPWPPRLSSSRLGGQGPGDASVTPLWRPL